MIESLSRFVKKPSVRRAGAIAAVLAAGIASPACSIVEFPSRDITCDFADKPGLISLRGQVNQITKHDELTSFKETVIDAEDYYVKPYGIEFPPPHSERVALDRNAKLIDESTTKSHVPLRKGDHVSVYFENVAIHGTGHGCTITELFVREDTHGTG